jgi:ribosome biogenesis GTPase A
MKHDDSFTIVIYTMLVVGVPNVGKSTIINALRLLSGKKKTAKTGAKYVFVTKIE